MPKMNPRDVFPNMGPALREAVKGAGFAAGTTARYGEIITAPNSGKLGRFLNYVIEAQGTIGHTASTTGPSAGLTTLRIVVEGATQSEATSGDTWTEMAKHGSTTDKVEFANSVMAGSTSTLNTVGAVFGAVDLERSAYRSHRLSVAAVTGSTAYLSGAFWISHQRRLVPDDVPTDQLIDLQHLA